MIQQYAEKEMIGNTRTEISGSDISGLNSGSVFHYPNFLLPILPDPKNSGNPNAQGMTL
jgi:hypothetical protein